MRRFTPPVTVVAVATTLLSALLVSATGASASPATTRAVSVATPVAAAVPVPAASPAVTTAQTTAASTGLTVQVPSADTATTSLYALPDGQFRTLVGTQALNYRNSSGAWVPVSSTLVPDTSAGYALENQANRFSVELPTTLATAPVRFSTGGNWVAFSLDGAAGTLSSAGTTATYANALPGVNAKYDSNGNGLEETLDLASTATPASYQFSSTANPGITLATSGNQIQVFDGGATVASLTLYTRKLEQ
jgi:hypothetical protein